MTPWMQAKLLAVRRRLSLRFRDEFDPYPVPPAGMALRPSEAHFHDYETAPLALSWRNRKSDDVAAWQAAVRAKLTTLCGYARHPGPPEIRHSHTIENDPAYDHRHFYLRARNGSDIPVSVLRAREASGPQPVMICLQGTNSGAHMSWGEARTPADPLKIAAGGDYARQAVAQGYVALCIEQAAFGERRERGMYQASADPCIDAANHALLLGRTLLGDRAADVSSVVDWLLSGAGSEEIQPARIDVMGGSAGGTTAVFAAGLDPRIDAVLASGCVGFIRETIGRRGDCSGQNVVPGILKWMEFDDVLGLIAPRPLLVISGDADHIWPYEGAAAVVDSAREIYRAAAVPGAIRAVAAKGGHRFYPEIAWPQFLGLRDNKPSDTPVR